MGKAMRLNAGRLARSLRSDLIAGLTVAMVGTPQCMAYAAIAGVAPVFGLYTGIIPTMIGSLFGSSRYLVTGPSNATSLVTANVLQSQANPQLYVEAVFALAVLSGIIKLALGVFRLGWIIRYVSTSVLMGFLAGASTLIVLGQISNLLGVPRGVGANALALLSNAIAHIGDTNLYALAAGVATMLLLLAFKRINKNLPAELLAITVAAMAVTLAGWNARGVHLVGSQGSLHEASILFHIPAVPLHDLEFLLPSAGAVAIFSLVEAMSIAKAVGLSSGEQVDPSREFAGQGLASLVGGFFRCLPSSGSPSRTAVNFSSGAQTRLAGVLSGLIVLLGLVVFGPLMDQIPLSSLAGVIMITAYHLVNPHQVLLAWQSNTASRVVLLATLLATLLLPLHIAIYAGALLSIAIYVHESSKLHLSYLIHHPAGGFSERSFDDILRKPPSIAIINIEGTLSFGAAEDLEQQVAGIVRAGVRVIILRARRMRLMGSEGVAALERIVVYAGRSGTQVLICGVRDEVQATLVSSGISGMIGAEAIFKAGDVLFASTEQALARAEEIVLAHTGHGD